MRSRWMPFLFLTALLNGAAAYCPQPAPCRTVVTPRAAVPANQNAHDYNGSDDTDTRDVALHYDRAGNLLWVNEGTLTGAPRSFHVARLSKVE